MKECFVPFRHGFDFFLSESAQKWIFSSFQVFWIKKFRHFHPFNADKNVRNLQTMEISFPLQNCMNNRQNFGTVRWIMNWKRKLWKVMILFFLLLLLFPSSIKLIRFSSLSLLSSLYGSPKQFFIFFSNPNKKAQNYQTFFVFCAYINIIVNVSGEANHK